MRILCYTAVLSVCLIASLNDLSYGDSERTEASVPETNWIHATPQVLSQYPVERWWTQYNDPYLNQYIALALQQNQTLKQAENRLARYRAAVKQQRSVQLPQVTVGADYTLQRFSDVQFPITNTQGGGFGNVGTRGEFVDFFTAPLTVSYEADLFLKNRDKTKAFQQASFAQEAQYHSVRLQLISELVTTYIQLLQADSLLTAQEAQVTSLKQEVAAQQSLLKAGLIAGAPVYQAQQALSSAEAKLTTYQRAQQVPVHRLGVLTGQTPAQLGQADRASLSDWANNNLTSVGLPSELVTHRPDIQVQEYQMRQAFLNVRVARKAFLPSLNLSANIGFFSATDSRDWFSSDALGGALAAGLLQPLFTGGRLKAELRDAQSHYEELTHAYQQRLLTAFEEVENSLLAHQTHETEYQRIRDERLAKQAEREALTARIAVGLAAERERYLLDAQLEGIKQSEAVAQANRLIDQVSLYKALGGGYTAPKKATL